MICTVIKSCSREVYKWISQQAEVGEESITDWMLYKANDLDSNIDYLQFDRFTEARVTGADFEFWILTSNYNFKARIQAKRLRQNHDHYNSIAYSNRHGLQIEKLRTDARRNGFRPLYALYNNEQETSRCRRNITDEGVYLACADELYNDILLQPRQQIDTGFLISRSTPFSCWFCCPLCSSTNNKSLIDFLNNYHPTENRETPEGITDEIPAYINMLIETQSNFETKSKQTELLKSEFARYFENISGLFVIDMRKIKK